MSKCLIILKGKIEGLSEAVARRCSVKKVFLEISQNLLENTGLQLYLKTDSGTSVLP